MTTSTPSPTTMTSTTTPTTDSSSYKILCFSGTELPASYVGLVVSRWTRTLKYGNAYLKLVDASSYWEKYPDYVMQIVRRREAEVRIAVLTDDPDVALGYAVYSRGPRQGDVILHYVHTQKDVRRQGIASALVEGLEVLKMTHLTERGMSFWTARLPKAVFDPFA